MTSELADNQYYMDLVDENGVQLQPGVLLKVKGGEYNGRIVRYVKTLATNYGKGSQFSATGYHIYFTIGCDAELQTRMAYHGVDIIVANKKMIKSRIQKLVQKTRDAVYYTKASGRDVAMDFFELQMLS